MNTKRQTIWLISMLSLMVVLSAYYLFSDSFEDLNNPKNYTVISDSEVVDVKDLTSEEETSVNGSENESTIDEILEQVQAEAAGGEAYFATKLLERNEFLAQESEKLMTIIADANEDTETISKALDELEILEDKQAKIENIEGELLKSFANVIVSEGDNDNWKIIVQSEKLEKSQAVSIVDLIMSELNASQDKIAVQYIK